MSRAAEAQTRVLRWDPPVDLSVTATTGAAWIAMELLRPTLAPTTCRWCAVDSLDAGIREALVWRRPLVADTLSDVTAFGALPVGMFGLNALAAYHDGVAGNAGVDTALVVEAAVVAGGVNELVRLVAARERPYAHGLPPEEKPFSVENNLSFFSGHTTEAFAIATAAGTVASMRGYRLAPLLWVTGGGLALATGYLRIASDKHWFTDVVVGMVVGAGLGFAIPFVFHRPEPPAPGSTRAPPGAPQAAIVSFAW